MMAKVDFRIVNSFGEAYVFGNAWEPNISGAKTGYKVNPLYQRPGGLDSGDPTIGARSASFRIKEVEKDPEAYIEALNTVAHILRFNARPAYLEERRSGYRQEAIPAGWGDRAERGMWAHVGTKSVDLNLLGGSWETISEETIATPSWIDSGGSLEVTNPGLLTVDCEIRVNPQSVNPSFTLRNNATEEGFTFSAGGFVPGSEFVMSGLNFGSIELDAQDLSTGLAEGSTFITLTPGVNTLAYSSNFGRALITVRFRPQRYEIV